MYTDEDNKESNSEKPNATQSPAQKRLLLQDTSDEISQMPATQQPEYWKRKLMELQQPQKKNNFQTGNETTEHYGNTARYVE